MPKTVHITGEGPELAASQAQVLELMEKHPDYMFLMPRSAVNAAGVTPEMRAAAPKDAGRA